jgi:hypothetical protein
MRHLAWLLTFAVFGLAQEPTSSEEDVPVFGVSVVLPAGLAGQIYKIKPESKKLPNLEKLKPVGTIYTYSLEITPRDFTQGIPGVPDLLEWFAIDYTGKFYVAEAGEYRFQLTSDDGSKLWIDGKEVIDNNGLHVPETVEGKVKLTKGVHTMHVAYFQGPRYHVALVLDVVPPGGRRIAFDMRDFKPPAEYFEGTEKR